MGAGANWELRITGSCGLKGAEVTKSRINWEIGLAGKWGGWELRITWSCGLMGAGFNKSWDTGSWG